MESRLKKMADIASVWVAAHHMNHNSELLPPIYLGVYSLFDIVGRSEVDCEIRNKTYVGG